MPRADHTATLLRDGQVLVVAGTHGPLESPDRLLVRWTAERYEPRTGRWTRTANLSVPRDGHTTTLLPNGDILVAGGVDAAGSAELFNPRHGKWTAAAHMLSGRYSHGAVLLRSGKVLVAGGCCGSWTDGNGSSYNVPLSSAEVYDPRTHRWNRTGDIVLNSEGTTLVLLPSGKVLAVGTTFDTPFNEHDTAWELYDPATGLWSDVAAVTLSRARFHPGTVTLLRDGRVLVAGGNDADGVTNHADLYDPRTNSWSPTASMTTARTNHTATLLPNGQVLVVGGCGESCIKPLASAEVYNPRTGTWTPVGNLHIARSHHTATLLPNGQVLVSGGVGDNGVPLASAELYTSLALQVAPMTALVNQVVTVTGVNFSPQEVVSLYWNNPGTHLLASVTTGGDGSFVVRLRLPQGRRGRHLIYAVGRRSQAPVSVTVAVR